MATITLNFRIEDRSGMSAGAFFGAFLHSFRVASISIPFIVPKSERRSRKLGNFGLRTVTLAFFLYLVCVEIAHEWKMLLLPKMVCLRTIGFVDRQRRTLFRLFSPGASHFYWCRAGYFQETLPPDMIGSGISADVIGSNKIVLIFYWPSIYYSDNIPWFEMRNVFFFLATQYCSCIKTIEGAWQNR